MAIGKAGAKNAGYLAAQIMALSNTALAVKLREERQANAAEIQSKNAAIQDRFSKK